MYDHKIKMMYRNWRGEVSERIITPISLFFGKNQYHQKDTWLIEAFDEVKGDLRTFSLEGFDMHNEIEQKDAVIDELVSALEWYQEQVKKCRKITEEGAVARNALDRDGGKIAKTALEITKLKEKGNV